MLWSLTIFPSFSTWLFALFWKDFIKTLRPNSLSPNFPDWELRHKTKFASSVMKLSARSWDDMTAIKLLIEHSNFNSSWWHVMRQLNDNVIEYNWMSFPIYLHRFLGTCCLINIIHKHREFLRQNFQNSGEMEFRALRQIYIRAM